MTLMEWIEYAFGVMAIAFVVIAYALIRIDRRNEAKMRQAWIEEEARLDALLYEDRARNAREQRLLDCEAEYQEMLRMEHLMEEMNKHD